MEQSSSQRKLTERSFNEGPPRGKIRWKEPQRTSNAPDTYTSIRKRTRRTHLPNLDGKFYAAHIKTESNMARSPPSGSVSVSAIHDLGTQTPFEWEC